MTANVRPWRTVGALGVSLVTLSAIATGTAASTPLETPRQQGQQTIELVAKRSAFSLPGVPSVGVGFIGGGDLFDGTGTNRIGEGYSGCTIAKVGVEVPPTFTAHCTSTYRITDGELHLSSLRKYEAGKAGFTETDLAIVGGTGKFATARGSGKATRTGTSPVTYKFTLTVVTDS